MYSQKTSVAKIIKKTKHTSNHYKPIWHNEIVFYCFSILVNSSMYKIPLEKGYYITWDVACFLIFNLTQLWKELTQHDILSSILHDWCIFLAFGWEMRYPRSAKFVNLIKKYFNISWYKCWNQVKYFRYKYKTWVGNKISSKIASHNLYNLFEILWTCCKLS